MDRQIIYPGLAPLDTDVLNTSRDTLVALGKLAGAAFGMDSIVNGLQVTPGTGLTVSVAPGEIYSMQNVDDTPFGALDADTVNQIVKQGVLQVATTLQCPDPGTQAGDSINYLIQAEFSETDAGAAGLPFFTSGNPLQVWVGPLTDSTLQTDVRQDLCTVSVVATAAAAPTGTQLTPAPTSTSAIGLAVVTVAFGQTSITSADISPYEGAAFVPQSGLASNVAHALYSRDVSGNTDVNLTPQEAAYPLLILTGTLSANINLVVPAVSRQRVINNRTAGGFTVTVKTLTGTGVAVPQNGAEMTFCDGVDVINAQSAGAPLTGGNLLGALNENTSTVASATTPDIWTGTGNIIDYTGTATATGFAAAPQAGSRRVLDCAAACAFTAGANMLIDGVPGGHTMSVSAGDRVEVLARTTTQFVLRRLRVDGGPPVDRYAGGNALANGSFEQGTDGWTQTPYTGGTIAIDTANATHGDYCLAITSSALANGGGQAQTSEYEVVGGGRMYSIRGLVMASVAGISSSVDVVWFDASRTQISTSNVFNSANTLTGSTPTAVTEIGGDVSAPSNARYKQLQITGGVPGAGAAVGTVYFDGFIAAKSVGSLVKITEMTASGTFTPEPSTTKLAAFLVGGGGGGGGGISSSGGTGGKAGSIVWIEAPAPIPATGIAVVIGGGGAGGSTSIGGTGGTTSFGPYVAPGGYGGCYAALNYESEGGQSCIGSGGAPRNTDGAGNPASANSGAGGGGGCTSASTAVAGGAGGSGAVLIWEFA